MELRVDDADQDEGFAFERVQNLGMGTRGSAFI